MVWKKREILVSVGKWVCFLLLLLVMVFIRFDVACAQEVVVNQDTVVQDTISKNPKTKVFIGSPTVSYSPETRIAAGLYGMYYFRNSRRKADTRASNIDLSIRYSQNKQFIVEPTWKVFSKRDKYVLTGDAIFQDFREFFYGIGNESRFEAEELYSFRMWRFNNRLQYRALERFFIGPHYHFQTMYNVNAKEGGLLRTQPITGAKGGLASGLGFAATIDYRNSVLSPSKGFYFDFSNLYFIPTFGSDFTFSSFTFDTRKYFNTWKKQVFAVQGYFLHTTGDPPFRMMAMVGGPQLMRGTYMGRFRDRNYIAGQAEYRLPLFWRVGVAGFVSAGEVAHVFKDFTFTNAHIGYGMGLRFLVNKKENLNARLDVGFGGDAPGIYATVGEAF